VRAFTVRKEAKQYGAGRLIEGPMREGDHVVVIEDVITTGGSALKAAEAIRKSGANISGILALVDREEGGRELLEQQGFRVHCLAPVSEILRVVDAKSSNH
jgi:orotate phosphoribosyltransferase